MLEYNLLGQTVTFGDSAERYYDLQFSAGQACRKASQEFNAWYKQRGDIKTVLDSYLPFVDSLMEELAFRPLFNQLIMWLTRLVAIGLSRKSANMRHKKI